MAGSSLWLVPPEESELYSAIHSLILNDVPSVYPQAVPTQFTPHVTLTADTAFPNSEPTEPQKWLDAMALPDIGSKFEVAIQEVEIGSVFFRKITMKCEKTPELCELAAYCRQASVNGLEMQEARKWVEEQYKPHCSLMYSELPEDAASARLHEVNKKVQQAKRQQPSGHITKGGSIWLVPTFKPIKEWKPVAIRRLPELEWTWDA